MRLFDTHVHLDQIKDIAGALKRAREAGVDKILLAGVDLNSSRRALEIYNGYKDSGLCVALGIHPYLPQKDTLEEIGRLIKQHQNDIAAVGEIGLDYSYSEARDEGFGRNLQKEVFKEQLALAKELNKPVIIHSRGAWEDCLKITREYNLMRVLFHWYTGPPHVLGEALGRGYYISVSPSLEYSKPAQQAALTTPNDKILLETDSPVKYRPQSGSYVSEPKDVKRVLKKLSELKKVPEEELAEITYGSSCSFFNITDKEKR